MPGFRIKSTLGLKLTHGFERFKLMTTQDLPELDLSFIETNDPAGPYGAKGVGESPLIPVAPAIANAVYNATGVRIRQLPLTPERVLSRLKAAGGAAQGPDKVGTGSARGSVRAG